MTGSYSGTWAYRDDQADGIIEQLSFSWTETLNGKTGCWTLQNVEGSASLSGGGGSPPSGPNCSATLGLASDAASNFQEDNLSTATVPFVSQENPTTGAVDSEHWFVQEYVPYLYGDPEGVAQSSDTDTNDWCYEPDAGDQPTANQMFAGGGCHIGTFYGGGPVDFLTFPVDGSQTATDDCSYTTTDAGGNLTSETLEQSVTIDSSIPHCADESVSATNDQPVTFYFQCTNPTGDPLEYFKAAPYPMHAQNIAVHGNEVIYIPRAGFTGVDQLGYFAKEDDGLPSEDATVTITVGPCDAAQAASARTRVFYYSARGSGETATDTPQAMGTPGYALYQELAKRGRSVGVTITGRGIQYPAVGIAPSLTRDALELHFLSSQYLDSVIAGMNSGVAALTALARSMGCSRWTVVLAGYSQGAEVMRRVLDGLPPAVQKHVATMIFFGDPYFYPREEHVTAEGGYDRDDVGILEFAALNPGLALGHAVRAPAIPNPIRAYSWCHRNDPVCQFGVDNHPIISVPVGGKRLAADVQNHLDYAQGPELCSQADEVGAALRDKGVRMPVRRRC
ncbi:MAG: cutinase family protein [Solirubrobacteraceae bacterium]